MIPSPSIAIVVLSGGQDSTTCLALAKAKYNEVHAITFDYNQRHCREIAAARNVAKLMEVNSHEIVVLGSPILKGKSPLTDPTQPLELYSDYQSMSEEIGDRVELTFVPMRNALFLTIAANRASCLNASVIITGVCQADNANYPDCRRQFINSQEQTINEALGTFNLITYVRIKTPLINMTKAESIKWMNACGELPLLAFTHTAYDGNYPPVSKDHANTLRAQGFLESGVPDPLVLRAVVEGLMLMPETKNYSNPDLNDSLTEEIIILKNRLEDKVTK